MSFTGEYRHTIDSKGRLIVPSRMRDEFSDDKCVLIRYMGGCIGMYSAEGWARLEKDLLEQGRSQANVRSVVRALAASAHQDEVDRQGRIGVPANLRDYAEVSRDVVVVGALDHAEIWSPERWAEEQAKVDEGRLDELAQELNF
ncbi:MAG: division/cell wall cluster transcriptional repressor MraZ [Actinomycetota bacterium]